MNIKCFGIAKDICENSVITIDSENKPQTVNELRVLLTALYPAFGNINSCMIAVNQEYADDLLELSDSDEIAIIPPVSGG